MVNSSLKPPPSRPCRPCPSFPPSLPPGPPTPPRRLRRTPPAANQAGRPERSAATISSPPALVRQSSPAQATSLIGAPNRVFRLVTKLKIHGAATVRKMQRVGARGRRGARRDDFEALLSDDALALMRALQYACRIFQTERYQRYL